MPINGDTTYSVTDLRKQLLANGFVPLPNADKACFFKGWPTVEVTEAEIERWGRRHKRFTATGVRIEGGLVAIDVDIDHDIAFALLTDLDADQLFPWALEAPLRHAGGNKFALFVRCNERFSRLHSRRWTPPGQSADDGTCLVEIFGGGSPRQFGCFGPHTIADGEVVKSYEWDGASLLDTALGDLPLVDKADMFAFIDAVEAHLEAQGFAPVKLTQTGETAPERVYDLAGDSFVTHEHGTVTLGELRTLVEHHDRVYLSASWLDGKVARNTRRCLASVTHSGALAVWDSMTGITHLEADRDPGTKERAFDLDRAAEQLRELEAREKNKLTRKDDHYEAAAKLLETYAFCPAQTTNVVPIWATGITEGMTLANFRTMMLPWAGEEMGPRGGINKINPVDLWASSDKRVTVEGLRLRPDMPRPLYEDKGKRWINTYTPPNHSGEGGIGPWIDFMEGLLPNPVEREWFLDWLAYKFAHPAVPGPGVVMVARNFGTGRGTLGAILKKLFGAPYVRSIPFSIFAGKSYQAQYNDWMADSLLVLVNESSESDGGSQYATKRDTYERIKETIEPRAEERMFVIKGKQAITGISFASFLIATNHLDALPVPEDDRRLAILTNGDPREPEFWEMLNAWIEVPGNIAALADWLADRGWGTYSPYTAPPAFEAKALMAEANKSDLDIAIEEAVEGMEGECFTLDQAIDRIGEDPARRARFPAQWDRLARRTLQSRLYRIGVRDGQNWKPMIEGARYAIYTRTDALAKAWTMTEPEVIKAEVLKNGKPGVVVQSAATKLRLLKGGKEDD